MFASSERGGKAMTIAFNPCYPQALGGDRRTDTLRFVDDGKNNMSPPADRTVWRKMVNVDLWNGDYRERVGVATNYEFPDIADSAGPEDLLQVQQAIAESKEPLRAHYNATNWVGYAVATALGIDITEQPGKQRVLALVNAWVGTGFFKKVERNDGRMGRKVKYIEVGEWAEIEE